MARRGQNFATAEARQLTVSFLHISQDPVVGNAQRLGRFWDRVAEHYNAHKSAEGVVRSPKSLENKWVSIKKETTKFVGVFSSIVALSESGTSQEQQLEKSLALYKSKQPKFEDFPYLECWEILRDIPRWSDLNQVMRKQTPLGDITNGSGDDQFQSPVQGLNDASAVGGYSRSSQSEGDEERGCSRPIGSKKAKETAKRQKIIDQSLMTQAKAAAELSSSILEKIALMKEQAMVALFALKDEDGRISAEGREFFALKRARDLARFKREIQKEDEANKAHERNSNYSSGVQSVGTDQDSPLHEGPNEGCMAGLHTPTLDEPISRFQDEAASTYYQPVAHRSTAWGEEYGD